MGERLRSERVLLTIAFTLFVAVTLWTAMHHEIWADEGDPWLMMRDADLQSALIAASNGGTPLLFHAFLWPFARMGAPVVALTLINLVFVWLAVLLLFRAQAFAVPVRILFAFSYFPAFEFAVIARPYGLQMLLTFALAAAWRTRATHPMKLAFAGAMLANVTTPGLFTAAIAGILLTVERLRDGTWRTPPIVRSTLVLLLGGLLSVAQLWPREGRQQVYQLVSSETLWYALSSTFFPEWRVEDFILPALLVLAIVVYSIGQRVVPLLFLSAVGGALLGIYVFVWMGGIRHAGLLLLTAVAAVWIADAYGPYRRERLLMAALAVSFALSIVPAAGAWRDETRYAFSGSREVAAFLTTSGLAEDAVLVAAPMFWTSPLVYLPESRLWNPVSGESRTFSLWEREDYLEMKVPLAEWLTRTERTLSGRRWLLLLNHELPEPLRARYRLRFRSEETIWRMRGETYWVYEPVSAR